jgi:hypothetical protein
LSAIGVSLVVYLLLAWWLAASASPDELTADYTLMIDRAAWGPLVLAGLLGATFSSALSSIVGAPRILQALAEHRILPGSSWLAVRSASGEPRNAMLFTGALVVGALMLRDLNAVAPLITMFFLITYAMINVVVLIEQSLRLVSFRPLLRIPRIVALLGTVGCIFAMLIVNLTFGLIAVTVVLLLHGYLVRKHLKAPYGDVRSGLFVAVAEWAAKKIEQLAGPRAKTWKANLLVPVEASSQARDHYQLLRDIARPKGFVRLLGLTGRRNYHELTGNLPQVAEHFEDDGIFATWTVVAAATFSDNVAAGMEALGGAFFRSNMLFLRLPQEEPRREEVLRLIRGARQNHLGVVLHGGASGDGDTAAGSAAIHVIVDKPDDGWRIGRDLGHSDLALLLAYKLKLNRRCALLISARLETDDEREEALSYLESAAELARIANAELTVIGRGEGEDTAQGVAVTISAITSETTLDEIVARVDAAAGECLLTMDSGYENALV